MASLSLQHINKTYPNGFEAVKDFNLEIEDKEFIIFVGPSGCGKSTTLRMVAGLEEITSGTLKIGDKVMNDVEPKDRDIAMVFQNYALYAMGRAIVRNPKVFLMDEPLSNLDAKLRVQMRIEISKIHQRLGATIIYVTHDQTEAMTLGTRIVVMKDGVVQQVDTPQNLYQKPGNLFVAGFMGSPQMNFLDAEIKEKGSDLVAVIGKDELVIPAAKAKALKDGGYVGKTVVMGIRPEDVADRADGSMSSTVKVYELLGAEVFLYFDVNGTQITARVDPGTKAKTGDPVKFDFNMEKTHFFDKDTELVITN